MVLKQNFSMEKITVSKIDNIFISRPIDEIVTNKLFCTFIQREDLNETISTITGQYKILYDKIFVLESKQTDEYICTYNIDSVNFDNQVFNNTILVHRKKETNTLYTINALNALIRSLNGGLMDPYYKINWPDYQNMILLTQNNELRKIQTKIFKIISL